jgi:hypothetical protein
VQGRLHQGKPPSRIQGNSKKFQEIPGNSTEIKVNEIFQLRSELL